jgi:hypothetical protein
MTQKMHAHDQGTQQHTAGKPSSPASVQPVESEGSSNDAAGKKEQHRVLKHSVETGQHERHPEEVAGQHATGSFTGGTGGKK